MKAFWYPRGKGAVHALLTFCSMQKIYLCTGKCTGNLNDGFRAASSLWGSSVALC